MHEIQISKFYLNKKTSYVYVRDVATIVYQLLKSDVKNEIFNLGFDESLSISDVLCLMGSFIKPGLESRIKCVPVEDNVRYIYEPFPSVTKGSVSTEKAKKILGYKPSDLKESFGSCVDFYKNSYIKYASERRVIEKELKNEWIKDPVEQEIFKNFIKQKSK